MTSERLSPVDTAWLHMDDSMGNRFGLVFLDLPTHEKTTESRLRGLEQRMDAMKGTREPLCIDGKRLRDVMFWVPHTARLGVGLSILSYAGKVIVGVRVDEAVTKNPRRVVELFEEEASDMLEKANGSY